MDLISCTGLPDRSSNGNRHTFHFFFGPGGNDDSGQEEEAPEPQPVDQRIDKDLERGSRGGSGLPIDQKNIEVVSPGGALTRNRHGLLRVVIVISARMQFTQIYSVAIYI